MKIQTLVDVLKEAQDVFDTHKNDKKSFMLEETKNQTI